MWPTDPTTTYSGSNGVGDHFSYNPNLSVRPPPFAPSPDAPFLSLSGQGQGPGFGQYPPQHVSSSLLADAVQVLAKN